MMDSQINAMYILLSADLSQAFSFCDYVQRKLAFCLYVVMPGDDGLTSEHFEFRSAEMWQSACLQRGSGGLYPNIAPGAIMRYSNYERL